MEVCNIAHIHRVVPPREPNRGFHAVDGRHKYDRTDNVEINDCTIALRLAAFDVPMDAMSDVDVVPMFCPKIMGMALPQVTRPVLESACKMPTDAEELCTATVTSVPARTPRMGFCSVVNRRTNSSRFPAVCSQNLSSCPCR